jgi:hypothetical protein
LQGGSERIAEELPSLIQQERLAVGEGSSQGGLRGFLFQLGGEVQGHPDNLMLQGRLGQQRRFRHFPFLLWTGRLHLSTTF